MGMDCLDGGTFTKQQVEDDSNLINHESNQITANNNLAPALAFA